MLALEMRHTQIFMNKPVYFGLSILELIQIVMYQFLYDYVKPKYGGKAKLCYMDTDSFIFHAKPDDTYKDIAKDVKTMFDTSNYGLNRSLSKQINKM